MAWERCDKRAQGVACIIWSTRSFVHQMHSDRLIREVLANNLEGHRWFQNGIWSCLPWNLGTVTNGPRFVRLNHSNTKAFQTGRIVYYRMHAQTHKSHKLGRWWAQARSGRAHQKSDDDQTPLADKQIKRILKIHKIFTRFVVSFNK